VRAMGFARYVCGWIDAFLTIFLFVLLTVLCAISGRCFQKLFCFLAYGFACGI
jgi:hypothetical protein